MIAPGTAPDDSGFVEVDGARLQYRIEGHGQPCMVVGSSAYYSRVFSQALREHLRLVFVDLRHFAVGDPSFSTDRITIQTYADDIEQARQTLGLGDIVVMGHSVHGEIALEYARGYPEHVRGVAAIGSWPRRSDEDEALKDQLWEAEASNERKEVLARQRAALTPEVRAALSPEALFVRTMVAAGPRDWLDPRYDASWLWEDVVVNLRLLDHLFGNLFARHDTVDGPPLVTLPVLLAHGRHDFAVPRTVWDEDRYKLPHHTFALFDRSGHYPPLEEPKEFDQALLTWVQGLQS
jgi:proline iminopeptidase